MGYSTPEYDIDYMYRIMQLFIITEVVAAYQGKNVNFPRCKPRLLFVYYLVTHNCYTS